MEFKYVEKGLIPAIIQDIENGDVLMLGYMNEEFCAAPWRAAAPGSGAAAARNTGAKGETSGTRQYVREIRYDCDADALLVKVLQVGPACHTGERSCFDRSVEGARTGLEPGDREGDDPASAE